MPYSLETNGTLIVKCLLHVTLCVIGRRFHTFNNMKKLNVSVSQYAQI